jgi:glycosyltransferase involved in cell wall biosynthesis
MTRCTVVAGDFTPWGGMDKANFELARYLAETAQWPITLVSHRVFRSLADHPLVTWQRVPRPFGFHTLGAHALERASRQRNGHQRSDHVLIGNGGNCSHADVNWVHAVHAAWNTCTDDAPLSFRVRAALQKRRARRDEAAALNNARIIITNSNRARAQIIDHLGLSASRVMTVYYGTDAEWFSPATKEERDSTRFALGWPCNRPVALFIGALGHDRNKGFDVLFEAWRVLAAERAWDVDLVAIGGGSDVPYWRAATAAAGLCERVRLIGFSHEVSRLLRAADVLVSPTRYEAYGLAVHEAICCGIPAFVTRCAGVAERYPADLRDLLFDDPPTVDDIVDKLRAWRLHLDAVKARIAPFSDTLRSRTWFDMSRDVVALLS